MKQMHGYSDGCNRSGAFVRNLKRVDLQQHNVPLSYQRSVATIRGRDMEKISFPLTSAHLSGGCGFKLLDRRKIFGTKFNCSHEGMVHAQADFPISLPSNTTCSL